MKLDLTIQEINLILASLGRMPYESIPWGAITNVFPALLAAFRA